MAEPTDMIMPILREMRTENASRHGEVLAKFDRVEQRLTKLEETQSSFKQALSADTLMSRLLTGEFEDCIEQLERKMKAMEGRA